MSWAGEEVRNLRSYATLAASNTAWGKERMCHQAFPYKGGLATRQTSYGPLQVPPLDGARAGTNLAPASFRFGPAVILTPTEPMRIVRSNSLYPTGTHGHAQRPDHRGPRAADLYWYLNENLADYANVQVVLDRREGDPGPAGPPARDLAGAWVGVRRQQPASAAGFSSPAVRRGRSRRLGALPPEASLGGYG
jgi:hypothetical protein